MTEPKDCLFRSFGSVMLLTFFACIAEAQSETAAGRLDASRVGWSAVQIKATKFFISMTAGVSVSEIDAAALRQTLIDPGEGSPTDPGRSTQELVIEINGLGRSHETRLLLNALTGAAVQRTSHDSRGRLRHRIYRFTDAGAWQMSWWPVGAEEERLPPGRWLEWSEQSEGLQPYTIEPVGSIVTEPLGLLYIISAAPLSEPGDRYDTLAYMRGHVFPVHVEVIGRENLRVGFDDHSGQSTVRRKGEQTAIKLSIRGEAGEDGENRFELFGMRGDILMHLDPETRAPLQLKGKIKFLGQVTMRIQSLTHRRTRA
jgi:hypothetical protein